MLKNTDVIRQLRGFQPLFVLKVLFSTKTVNFFFRLVFDQNSSAVPDDNGEPSAKRSKTITSFEEENGLGLPSTGSRITTPGGTGLSFVAYKELKERERGCGFKGKGKKKKQQNIEAKTKVAKFHQNHIQEIDSVVLLYPDRSEVNSMPGSEEQFILQRYKEELGKPYSRICLYLCKTTEYLHNMVL
eukprot:gene2879-3330_t